MARLGVKTTTDNFLKILKAAGFTTQDFYRMKIEEQGIEVIDAQEFNVFTLYAEEGPHNTAGKIEKILIENQVSFTWG